MTKPLIKVGYMTSTIQDVPDVVLRWDEGKKGKKIPYTLMDCISDELSYEVPNLQFVLQSRPNWDGRIRLFKISRAKKNKKYDAKFHTGLVFRIIKIIHETTGIISKVEDYRKKPGKNFDLEWNPAFKIRDYQQDVIDECLKKGRGLINLCTGAGKTIVVSKIIQELGVSPFIFYVLTKDLMSQAKERLEASIPGLECGIVGDGVCDIKGVTVMTIQTAALAYGITDLAKDMGKMDGWSDGELSAIKNENLDHIKKKEQIKELIEGAKGIYFDEAHHAAAKVCEEVITKSKKAYYCYGGTATPSREDNADLMLEGLFGKKRGNITASFLIRKGYLVRPEIYFLKLKKKGSRAATYDQDYKENLMYNEERNGLIVAAAEKMRSMGLPTLVLVQRIDHGKLLESMIEDSVFVHGSSSKKKRSQILKDFENGDIQMLIASTIADEGLDLPVLEALIHASGGKSKNRIRQRVGRVIRIDKNNPNKRAIVIDFDDTGHYVGKHSRDRKRVLQSEEEFSVSTINGLENISDIFADDLF